MNNKIISLESKKYELRLDNFEGPLDLLCYLIDKNKMDIYKVSISDITDQYIQYLKTQEELNLEIASEFLVMASTLLLIKSKGLLPKEDEEENFILYFDKFRPCRSSKLSVLIKNTEVNLIKTKGKFKTELFPDIVFSDGENSKKIENNYKKDFISYLLNIVCSDVFADKDLIGF